MQHETALIAILTSGLGLPFIFGFLAARLSLPPPGRALARYTLERFGATEFLPAPATR